jgi:hypothetical protein
MIAGLSAGLSVELEAVFRIGRLSKRRSCSEGRKKAGPPSAAL